MQWRFYDCSLQILQFKNQYQKVQVIKIVHRQTQLLVTIASLKFAFHDEFFDD